MVPLRVRSLLAWAGLILLARPGWTMPAGQDLASAMEALRRYEWGGDPRCLHEAEAAARTRPSVAEPLLVKAIREAATEAGAQRAARLLAVYGTDRAVPDLERMLLDPQRGAVALMALDGIPGSASTAALRRALRRVPDPLADGIAASLGARRDAAAVPALAALLRMNRPAARGALVAIATPAALNALDRYERAAPAAGRERAAADCVAAAARVGDRALAIRTLRRFAAPRYAARVRAAAFRALVEKDAEGRVARVRSALTGKDDALRLEAVRAVEEAPSESDPSAYLADWPTLAATTRTLLLEALGRRGDRRVLPLVRRSASSGPAGTRAAAIDALGQIGEARDVPMLARTAADGPAEIAQAARTALRALRGVDIERAILAQTEARRAAVRLQSLEALRDRAAVAAAPRAARRVADPYADVRRAALRLLGSLGSASEAPALLVRLRGTTDEDEREAIGDALNQITARWARQMEPVVLAAWEEATAPARPVLLHALSLVGGPRALEAVRSAVRDPSPEVASAAIRALADWPDASAAADLLRIVRTATDRVHRALAFRGYVQMCRDESISELDRLAMLRTAWGLANGAPERRQVLGALGLVAHPEALQMALMCADDPETRVEAEMAVVGIAERLPAESAPSFATALERIAAGASDQGLAARARAAATRLSGSTGAGR